VVEEVSEEGGETVSSTAIRGDLAAGEIGVANRRLGYRWFVIGKVIPGDRRGRELGFPTANLRLEADCRLRHSYFAERLQRGDGSLLDGVASYGRRPTFDDGPPLLEVHAFDFAGDLYGETVTVSFVAWIRPEVKFTTVPELVAAIGEDCAAAKALLREAGPGTALDQALTGGG
jgi:riboflavin kinase/FMN adenylyltransferase